MRVLGFCLWFLWMWGDLWAQVPVKNTWPQNVTLAKKYAFNTPSDSLWADSLFKTLTPPQRLAQLFMIAVNPADAADVQKAEMLVSNIGVGGVIFFRGHPYQIAGHINQLQAAAKTPLLVGIDGEWGLAMRMDTVVDYPKQMMLGAIQNDSLIYQMGLDIGYQCRRMGIHVNFAPVVDINVNPLNPIINYRSFGQDRLNVANKGVAYMRGMQDAGVIACAKHFPGHGDVSQDSHLTLPTVSGNNNRLDSIELFPFRQMIANGCQSIMVAHLNVPALTGVNGLATTLSSNVVNGLLKTKYAFKGLVFTDALNMKGVANSYAPGVVDAKALIAGNDVLLYSQDVEKGIAEIDNGVARGEISRADVDTHVKKVLMAKAYLNLKQGQRVNLDNLHYDLNDKRYKKRLELLIQSSMTAVKNRQNLIPLHKENLASTAVLSIGDGRVSPFQNDIRLYATCRNFVLSNNATALQWRQMAVKLLRYKTVVVSLQQVNTNILGAYTVPPGVVNFVNQLAKTKKVILVDFGSPYALKNFTNVQAILCAYSNESFAQMCAARIVTGQASATGRLPVSAGANMPVNTGVDIIAKPYIFNLTATIDSICLNAINEDAFPGCRVLAYHGDSVLFNKSYGHYTYEDGATAVNDSTLYDLASVTKTAATTIAAMRLYEEGKIDLNKTIGDYLPGWEQSNKRNITVLQLMTHTGGLKAWLPFYKYSLMPNGKPDTTLYAYKCDSVHCVCVTEHLYLMKGYADTMWRLIRQSPVGYPGRYLYSDLDFIFMQKIVETITQTPLDVYVQSQFYAPMRLTHILYNPFYRIPIAHIAPTTNDILYRHEVIQGYVHDPAAAMLGGVAGHAGLFSTASDLAQVYRLLMNGGVYDGVRYFKPETVDLFTRQQLPNVRRGLGFDKAGNHTGISDMASPNAFGHTGFTGTCVWADPDNKLLYVFLSNRTYPREDNWKIVQLGVRNAIHDALYTEINKARN